MLNKNGEKRGKCPFNKMKRCSEECVFYRKGVRFDDKNNQSFPFEECAMNIIADNIEMVHSRVFSLQKEVGETKNASILKILFDMGKIEKEEVLKLANKIDDDIKKLE